MIVTDCLVPLLSYMPHTGSVRGAIQGLLHTAVTVRSSYNKTHRSIRHSSCSPSPAPQVWAPGESSASDQQHYCCVWCINTEICPKSPFVTHLSNWKLKALMLNQLISNALSHPTSSACCVPLNLITSFLGEWSEQLLWQHCAGVHKHLSLSVWKEAEILLIAITFIRRA